MGVRATGLQSFKHVILFFFGMGTMVHFLKHEGSADRERDRLKMSVKTPTSWNAHTDEHTAWDAIRTHSFADVHPFEGSGYIHDRKGEWTDLFCSSRGSALCMGGVVSLETSIKMIKLVR